MAESAIAPIRIVLVETAGALNVGSIARVMKNMGLNQLVLVNPQCDPLSPEARQMAVHAVDLLEKARIVATLPEALAGCVRAIATTARPRGFAAPLEHPRVALPWLLDIPSALIFGPEDRGLNNLELNYAQRFVGIPSHPTYPSLNLAQAVAVCCYELYQAIAAPALPSEINSLNPVKNAELESPAPKHGAATLDELEGYYQHLEQVLLQIGYLYPHTAESRMRKFRQILKQAALSQGDLALLRGILHQVEWAVQAQGNRTTIP